MKATLEFKLPEEQEEFNLACNAANLAYVLREIYNFIRNKTKNPDPNLSEGELELLEEVKERIIEEISDLNIDF